jgi:RimJ/RimL family protein N-acetyltransferase
VHLETERLLIRPWRHEEAERMLDIQSRLEVVKWLGDGEPVLMKDLDEAHARIDKYAARSSTPPLGQWAIERVADGVVLGTVLLLTLPNDEHGEVEIGWHLHPDSWGRGYASEAAAAVLRFGFEGGLPEIIAVSHTNNEPSKAVMRRIGMTDHGVTDKWYDDPSALFMMTAEQWFRDRR